MDSKEFSRIRHYLGKSQSEIAKLLCVSSKAVQSFEQGWRNIPTSAERQLLLLLSLKITSGGQQVPCWEMRNCPDEWKVNCPAFELKAGHLCWFINGTFCSGKCQDNWRKKIEICRKCEVFQKMTLLIEG